MAINIYHFNLHSSRRFFLNYKPNSNKELQLLCSNHYNSRFVFCPELLFILVDTLASVSRFNSVWWQRWRKYNEPLTHRADRQKSRLGFMHHTEMPENGREVAAQKLANLFNIITKERKVPEERRSGAWQYQ